MLKKTFLYCTVFVWTVYCKSTSRIDFADQEKDIDLILELEKLRADPCSLNPCQNEGTCVKTDNDFKCVCTPPYFGDTCNKDPCMSSPCYHDGECELDKDGFKCVCKSPYSGETCKLLKNPCSPNPCENDGNCELIGNRFNCTCKIPYHGDNCELGPCSPNPCKNGGECEEEEDNFKCSCESPFTGTTCEQNACSSNPCLNNGGCKIDGDTFSCNCEPPYKGKYCEIGPCSSNPCLNNGGCRVMGLEFKCECKPPYTGSTCELRNTIEPDILKSTSDSTMTSSATNHDITDTNDQRSSDSFTSTIDADDTSTDSNSTMLTTLEKEDCGANSDCLNGGTCRNKSDEHYCDCPPNFGGIRCEVNLLCVSLDQSCQIINAVCVVVNNHAICECPNGTLYHPKSGLCEDICDQRKCVNGNCEIIGRTYKCNCEEGYTGSHCDEKEKVHHENFIPWFSVIASIGLFTCILIIAMFCVICQIKTFISSA